MRAGVEEALGSPEFRLGLGVGLVAAFVALGLGLGRPGAWRRALAGALLPVSALVAVALAPALGASAVPAWAFAAAGLFALVGGGAVARVAQRGTGFGALLATSLALGTFLVVPDTEQALALAAAAAPFAVATLFGPIAVGAVAAFAYVAVDAWVIALGGHARFSAVVGAAGCAGLAVVEVVATALGRPGLFARLLRNRSWRGVLGAAAAQGAWTLFASRVAGRPGPLASVLVLGAGLLAALAFTLSTGRAPR